MAAPLKESKTRSNVKDVSSAPERPPAPPALPVQPPPARKRYKSLVAMTMRTAALRVLGGQVGISDATLATALNDVASRLDHQLYTVGEHPKTIEELLHEAIRIGVNAGSSWWTGTKPEDPYYDISDTEQLVGRVCSDALPELMVRYYMLEDKPCATSGPVA